MSEALNAIDNSDAELKRVRALVTEKKNTFDALAAQLTEKRTVAGAQLRTAILHELPDLKLGQADFLSQRTDATPSGYGVDDIVFMIKTNPGMPFSPLHRAASGG